MKKQPNTGGVAVLYTPKTDLAAERFRADLRLPGIERKTSSFGNVEEERITVTGDAAAASVGKPPGTYVTLSFPAVFDAVSDDADVIGERLSTILTEMTATATGKRDAENLTLLIVGLGNRAVTADEIGVLAAERIHATAHLRTEEPELFRRLAVSAVTILTPGVLADSGMEAADRVKALLPYVKPDAVIVIDALAARSYERILRTIQIADSGLAPGSGIGNRRKTLSRETLGVPVFAIGVPTVCDTVTFVRDALALLPDEESPAPLLRLAESESGSFVTRGDCDLLTRNLARLIGDSINRAFGILL